MEIVRSLKSLKALPANATPTHDSMKHLNRYLKPKTMYELPSGVIIVEGEHVDYTDDGVITKTVYTAFANRVSYETYRRDTNGSHTYIRKQMKLWNKNLKCA